MASESAGTEHKVRIHIDRMVVEAMSPTTGAELYSLGQVGGHRELFREVSGDQEDEFVPRDGSQILLKQDEHFYTEKEISIIVNARKKETVETALSFTMVVKLAFDNVATGPNVLYTITYRDGPKKNPKGTLVEGQIVKVKQGMIFNVIPTDKS